VRIVGGKWAGRHLTSPADRRVRPTAEPVRDAWLRRLEAELPGARVLDLFAGTGAMGLEALSRGAAFALFVDDGAQARGLIRENVETLGLGGATRLFRRDAPRMGAAAPNAPFSLVFCDPPYGKDLAPQALRSCAEGGWLTPDALVVVEEAQGVSVMLPDGFEELERRDYGETKVVFGRLTGGG
jgi:16S rRNA (guanine966-N2)-methyltransferase